MSQHLVDAIKQGQAVVLRQWMAAAPNWVNASGWTPPPLHCTVLWNQPQMAEVLLDAGAELEMLDPDRQTTPLRYAVMYAKPEMIRLLVARGASCDPIHDGGSTALELAREAANGAYAEFDDLPRPSEFAPIVQLLEELTSDGD